MPASQVSGLSVGAEYRGRGVATDLLRNYLAEVHERGAAISTLFPAAVQLYRRAGYEYAGTCNLYEVAARHLPAGWPDGWRARSVPPDDPAPLQERFARVAAGRSGQVDRDADTRREQANQFAECGVVRNRNSRSGRRGQRHRKAHAEKTGARFTQ